MRSQEPFSVFIEISSKPLPTLEATVPSRFAAIAFCTKAMSTIVKSIFSSKAYQSFLEAEPQDPQSSGTADAVKCNGIAASGEKDAQTMSPTQDNHYQPTNNASSTRLAAKCHPDADAVCAELDAFFAQNWPWANDRAREEFLKTDCNRWACWALPLARSDRILDTVKVNTLLFLLDGSCLPPPRLRDTKETFSHHL